jgi:guanosine-3',5'-bis(diphosphate) 3'-pyrophosphohydrolase
VILLFKSLVHVPGHMRGGVFVSPHVRRADTYADRAHTGQYRKGKPGAPLIPYIEHPRAVARILHDEAGIVDPVTLQAALLHDTMEDTGATHENLVAEFGHDVADVVRELTNPADFGPGGKAAWQAAHAKTMSARAAAVKVADKTANLRDLIASPPDWPAERKRKYFEDAMQVVQAMGHKHPIMERLFSTTYLTGLDKL